MAKRMVTLFECFEFLAEHEATISFARNPINSEKTRCVVRIGSELATVEYVNTEFFPVVTKFLGPVCDALRAKVEGENNGLKL